ncbi:response regulator [Candidatus Nitrospira bockiana]
MSDATARILIVDDDPGLLEILPSVVHFSMPEAQVESCLWVEDAVKRLYEQAYDVVITDLRMPKVDGTAFIQEIRKYRPYVPVVIISGCFDGAQRAKQAGCYAFLAKPFDRRQFLRILQQAVRLGHTLRQIEQHRQAIARAIPMVMACHAATKVVIDRNTAFLARLGLRSGSPESVYRRA